MGCRGCFAEGFTDGCHDLITHAFLFTEEIHDVCGSDDLPCQSRGVLLVNHVFSMRCNWKQIYNETLGGAN